MRPSLSFDSSFCRPRAWLLCKRVSEALSYVSVFHFAPALVGKRASVRTGSDLRPLYQCAPKLGTAGGTAGEEYLRSTKALLLRASLMKHDLIQASA